MTRKLKVLGLAFVAVLAFGAFSATAASAASFHSEAEHTIIDGAQPVAEDDVWTFNAGTVKCTSATYSGTTSSATSSTVVVTPTYSGCTAFGFVNAVIEVNTCLYFLFGSTFTELSCVSWIAITAFNCHIKMGSQSHFGVSYDNAGSGTSRDVTLTMNISGIKYTQENKSFPNCTGGAGTFSNGTFQGSATLTGTNTTGGAVGIWKS